MVLGALTCAAGYGSKNAAGDWFKNGNAASWFNYWGKGAPCEHEYENGVCIHCGAECKHEYDENGVCTKCGENDPNFPRLMLFSSDNTLSSDAYFVAVNNEEQASNVYTLTAVLTPADSYCEGLIWTSDNEECVRVTPSATDKMSATVEYLKAFSDHSVLVTCSVINKPELTATCKMRSLTKYTALGAQFSVFNSKEVLSENILDFNECYNLTVVGLDTEESPKAQGTLTGTFEIASYELRVSKAALNKFDPDFVSCTFGEFDALEKDYIINNGNSLVLNNAKYYREFLNNFDWKFPDDSIVHMDNASTYAELLTPYPDGLIFDLTVNYVYGGKVYDTFTVKAKFGWSLASLLGEPTKVEIPDDTIILY